MSRRHKTNLPVKPGTPADYKFVGPLRVDLNEHSITIDASKLPPPSKSYAADTGWATYRPGHSSLFFAVRDETDPSVLPSRLEIRMPPEDFLRGFLWNSREFLQKVVVYAEKWGGNAIGVAPAPTGLRAGRTHSEWANFVYIAHAGTETSLDFYQMSVSGIAKYAKTKDLSGLALQPVVRVHMSVFELISMMRLSMALEEQVLRDAPEEVKRLADLGVKGEKP